MAKIHLTSTLNDVIDRTEWLNDELLDGDCTKEEKVIYQKEYEALRPLYRAILQFEGYIANN